MNVKCCTINGHNLPWRYSTRLKLEKEILFPLNWPTVKYYLNSELLPLFIPITIIPWTELQPGIFSRKKKRTYVKLPLTWSVQCIGEIIIIRVGGPNPRRPVGEQKYKQVQYPNWDHWKSIFMGSCQGINSGGILRIATPHALALKKANFVGFHLISLISLIHCW